MEHVEHPDRNRHLSVASDWPEIVGAGAITPTGKKPRGTIVAYALPASK
jgi:hypothetical protein